MNKEYAAAIVTLLNRENNEEKTAYMYPIIRIQLQTSEAKKQKVYIVKNGRWEEE